MTSVLCPSVIQREIDCMFICCTVPVGTPISWSLIILDANQTVIIMYVTKINHKIVACISFSFFMTLSVLLYIHAHARMHTFFSIVTLECQTFYFLVICCCCKMRDVTCVYVSFVRLAKSNSIVKMNWWSCVTITVAAGAYLIEMLVYMSYVQLVDLMLHPVRLEWIKYESL
jgi:hypothetical protein